MTKDELIGRLNAIEGNPEVCILDGFNGGGEPRTINLGPHLTKMKPTPFVTYDDSDIDTDGDGSVIMMGYGCY